MKKLQFIFVMILLVPFFVSAQTGKSEPTVKAYYFHNTSRCITCKTVEAQAKADLNELYGEKVSFEALNLEEKSTDAIAQKLKVSGQTLLVIKGDKQVNLTNEGFLYAVTDPDKFKAKIREKVDPLVK